MPTPIPRWLALPPAMEPQRNEVLLKVFFGRAVPPEVMRRNLAGVDGAVRAELAELERIAAELGRGALARHPDAPYWALTLDFGRSALRAALGWLARAELALRARPRSRLAARPRGARRALRTGGAR